MDARVPAVAGRPGPGGAGLQSPDGRAAGHRRSSGRSRPRPGDRGRQRGGADRDRVRGPGLGPYHGARPGGGGAQRRGGAARRDRSGHAHHHWPGGRSSGGAAVAARRALLGGVRAPGDAGGRVPGAHHRRGRVPGRHVRTGGAMTVTPYQSRLREGPYGFADLLHAEWTKFRTVRGWIIAVIVGGLAIVAFALAPGQQGSCNVAGCTAPVGPGGEEVSDSFYFVHQSLPGNGSITARVTSLTGQIPVPAPGAAMRAGLVPWAKAGIMIKASTSPGSAYAAMMVTGSHGVRMQDDFTQDMPGLAGAVSATSPRWLRLTRSGDTITGYDSADGTHWAQVGTATLAGLPQVAQVGLFTTSPGYLQTSLGEASVSGGPSVATGVFDHVGLSWPSGAWAGNNVGGGGGSPGGTAGSSQAAGTFT